MLAFSCVFVMLMETFSLPALSGRGLVFRFKFNPASSQQFVQFFCPSEQNTKPKKIKFLKFQCVDSRKQMAGMVSVDHADILYLEAQKLFSVLSCCLPQTEYK